MRFGRSSIAPVLALAALAASVSCSEQHSDSPLGPRGDVIGTASPQTIKVNIKRLQLASNTLRLDGPADSGSIDIANSGLAIPSGVSLHADIVQGSATRQALDELVDCAPGGVGKLPTGVCTMAFAATASNSSPGTGTLAPGAAVLTMHIMQGTTELANKSVNVNLVGTPSITSLTLASTTIGVDGPGTTYTAMLQNPAKSLQNVILQGWIIQGTTKRAAGGAQVLCGSAVGVLPPGPCTLSSSLSANDIQAAGSGTFVPGPATYELDLTQNNNGVITTFDTKQVAITLASTTPSITSLTLSKDTLIIDAFPTVTYTATLQNYGYPLNNVSALGDVVQGSAERAPGANYITCGSSPVGVLPTGVCTIQYLAAASNSAAGTGTLVPGSGTFELDLLQISNNVATQLDSKSLPVNLVSTAPRIVSLTLGSASTNFTIEGAAVSYTATLQNYGSAVSNVVLQADIVQGTTDRAAGGITIDCGSGSGVLPTTASCIITASASASNSNAGSGTLVAGDAHLVVHMYNTSTSPATELDSQSLAITLAVADPCATPLPKPQVTVAKAFLAADGNYEYDLNVTNYADYDNSLFAASPNLPACGLNTSASRTWVDILRGDNSNFINGFCALSQNSDLNGIWFQAAPGTQPATFVVQLTDRLCSRVVESDPVATPTIQ